MGLNIGTYSIEPPDLTFQYKFLSSSNSASNNITRPSTNISTTPLGYKTIVRNTNTNSAQQPIVTMVMPSVKPSISSGIKPTMQIINGNKSKSTTNSASLHTGQVRTYVDTSGLNLNTLPHVVEDGATIITAPSVTEAGTSIVHMSPVTNNNSSRIVYSNSQSLTPTKQSPGVVLQTVNSVAAAVSSTQSVLGTGQAYPNVINTAAAHKQVMTGVSLLPPNIASLSNNLQKSATNTLTMTTSPLITQPVSSNHIINSLSAVDVAPTTASASNAAPTTSTLSNNVQYITSQMVTTSSGETQQVYFISDNNSSQAPTSGMKNILTIPVNSLTETLAQVSEQTAITVNSLTEALVPGDEQTISSISLPEAPDPENQLTGCDSGVILESEQPAECETGVILESEHSDVHVYSENGNGELLTQDMTSQEVLQKTFNADNYLVMKQDSEGVMEGVIDNSVADGTQEQYEEVDIQQQIQEGDLDTGDQLDGINVPSDQVLNVTGSHIYQTPEGIIIIQNPDGSTLQLQGGDGEPVPLETVQALLAMDSDCQILQTVDESDVVGQ